MNQIERQIQYVQSLIRKGLEGRINRPLNRFEIKHWKITIQTKLERLLSLGDDTFKPDVVHFEVDDAGSSGDEVKFTIKPLTSEAAEMLQALAEIDPVHFVTKETEMFKHANTLFPGDEVYGSLSKPGSKLAGTTRTGTVKRASDDDGSLKLEVEWSDGTTSWEDPNTLQKKG